MKTRLLGIALLSGVLAINGCSSGNDNGKDGSIIGLAPDGADDAGGSTPGEGAVAVVLAFGSGSGDTFSEGMLATAQDTLAASGQTTITATAVNTAQNNELVIAANTVSFKSQCTLAGTASITESVTSSNSIFNAFYTALGCEGTDTITATLVQDGGIPLEASGLVTVASADAGGIQFESIDNSVLSINRFGSSTRPESTKVRFRVVDKQDLPVLGAKVSFALSNTIGGTALLSDTAEVDIQGFAIATVIAGRVNTTVWVTATVANENGELLSTSSDAISINTGLPDQNSFSLVATDTAPRSADWDGTEVDITIRAADTYNNPVRDGTVVNFRAEAGSIEPTCSTVGGGCTVKWVSQNPRPINFNADFAPSTRNVGDARAIITAYSEGEEYLQADLNANGLMDIGEPFESMPEVFEDFNSNNRYDATPDTNGYDEYVDFNNNGSYDLANDLFDGLRCSEAAITAGHCANTIQVRDTTTLCIAGSEPNISVTTDGFSFSYTVTDQYTNSLPSGSTIALSVENGDLGGTPEVGPTLGVLGTCNEGFTASGRIIPDPEATDAPALTINVTAGQSGLSVSRKISF